MLRKIDDLTADPANPRRLTEAAAAGLAASMLELGDVGGIVWNRRTGHLVAGHARVAQLRAAGATEWEDGGDGAGAIVHPATGARFPVRIVEWDRATARAALVAANNPAIAGDFTAELAAG